MDDTLLTLKQLLDNPEMEVDDSWVETMQQRYPYFQLPALLRLQRKPELSPEQRRQLTERVALYSSSTDALYRLMEPIGAATADFYPPTKSTAASTTDEAITTFIDNYGNQSTAEEEAILERLIFNPVPDYAQILADEEERSLPDNDDAKSDTQEGMINAFILKSRENSGHFPPATPAEPETKEQPKEEAPKPEPIKAPSTQDDTLLSESLAKIYIKQRRYSKAYEIISNLSLKYPEKSVYFADQMRFLQKLIINQKYLKQK
jgi:hypothetical protein